MKTFFDFLKSLINCENPNQPVSAALLFLVPIIAFAIVYAVVTRFDCGAFWGALAGMVASIFTIHWLTVKDLPPPKE